MPKCPTALRIPLMFERPLNVFICALRGRMFDQISWEQNSKYKKKFYVYEKREKILQKIKKNLILKHNPSADLKSF